MSLLTTCLVNAVVEPELRWSVIRQETCERFRGQTPRAEDEAVVIEHFEAAPKRVLRAIDEMAGALEAGQVTWAWSTLRARLERGGEAVRESTVSLGKSRENAVARAEQWIHAAGQHFDREEEVVAALFSGDGILRAWQDDVTMQGRMIATWREARANGERIEAEELQRAQLWKVTVGEPRKAKIEKRTVGA